MQITGINPAMGREQFRCKCGGWQTHIEHIDVTDGLGTTRITPGGEDGRSGASVEFLAKKESGRRHTVTLHFYCESCFERQALSLQQHKGDTFVRLHAWKPIEGFGSDAPVFTPAPHEV